MSRTDAPFGWVLPLSLTPPRLGDNTADMDRLVSALKTALSTEQVVVPLGLARRLPQRLRTSDWQVRCVLLRDRSEYRLLDVLSALDLMPITGAAVDLGTTRVVVRLMDLVSGAVLGETAFDNPQAAVGPDILTRTHHADCDQGLASLRQSIVTAVNHHLHLLCMENDLSLQRLYALSLAGNTVMTHLFLGLSPHWMVREPYIPVVNTPPVLSGADIGIDMHPFGRVLVFPNVGSYFGGDLIAGILYSGLHTREETSLLVDVGTNAEVVLGNCNWMVGCAGAAGPALEGGAARMGMPAGPGAIDRVRIDPVHRRLTWRTIADRPPVGICGSGLIDLAAQMFRAGLVDIRGKIAAPHTDPRLSETGGIRQFTLVSENECVAGPISLSQPDLDSLMRSKAAMYTILTTLVNTVGLGFEDIDTFYVAGTFGAVIDPESAIGIGMLPDLDRKRFKILGNSALEGATRALVTNNCLPEIDAIRNGITYLELNVNQAFMAQFSAAKFLPHTDRRLFPSVSVPTVSH